MGVGGERSLSIFSFHPYPSLSENDRCELSLQTGRDPTLRENSGVGSFGLNRLVSPVTWTPVAPVCRATLLRDPSKEGPLELKSRCTSECEIESETQNEKEIG